jgi:HTH-type transcriptional regulator/antitoxin PezA
MTISEIIKDIRLTHGLSQENFAKILKVSQKAISNWEAGNDKPNSESLIMIYKKFNITPNEILGIENYDYNFQYEHNGTKLIHKEKK